MGIELLAGIDVKPDEIEFLLQLGDVERRGEPRGCAARAEGVRVVVEQGDGVKATFPHHVRKTRHGIDQVVLPVLDPVRIAGNLGRFGGLEPAGSVHLGHRRRSCSVSLVDRLQ